MTQDDRVIAEEIVSSMQTTMDRVYNLGSFKERVSLYSQQCRAYNLIWALFEQGILKKDAKVAIVGAGAGGITAAAAALIMGCYVKIYEKSSALLNTIRGNHTRYIHPYILDWPFNDLASATTNLP